jgi:hypothetical protein
MPGEKEGLAWNAASDQRAQIREKKSLEQVWLKSRSRS